MSGRLGPGPDGPRNRTDAAGLEVANRSLAERTGSRVGNAALERPAEPGYHSEELAGHRPKAQACTKDSEELDGALAVDVGAVGPGDSKHHADLVQRQRRQICAGEKDCGSQDPVLLREARDDLLADRLPDPWQLRGKRVALVSGARRDPLDDLLDGQGFPRPNGQHVRGEYVRKVGNVSGSATDQDDEGRNALPRCEPEHLLVVTARGLTLDRIDEERSFIQVGSTRGAPTQLAERSLVATLAEGLGQLSDGTLRTG